MAADTITRAQLLLQYYTALSELEAEARAGESAFTGTRYRDVLPIFLQDNGAARASAA